MRRRSLILGAAAGLAAPVVAGAAPAAAASSPIGTDPPRPRPRTYSPANRATGLTTLPEATRQVVVVTAASWNTSQATLETFAKVDGRWTAVSAALSARIGSQFFSDNHVEGVPTTPTGVYAFGPTIYGIAADPGVRHPYHRVVTNDWWNENPTSSAYNTFQHQATSPGGYSEALWTEKPAYTHFAVITYNMAPTVPKPVPNAGSGIFLHEFSKTPSGPTAGCVSLSHADLVTVLRWLDPAAQPRIVMCPLDSLGRY
ncbi:L,D-transpeptidase family protein [Micromonospora robiginosa]|uniref:L,D-transpeptidase family protein n=1 Tax=Micromonospora robiginosa TaxID=2749844 RepID=A0A7L6BAS2_9ACTN|nr:L,D-transpeptidase family protein [Micromonospora ferruginea]QLQ39082.1 L,D-transpeptidase family protein [Micromonospora ferruginea]